MRGLRSVFLVAALSGCAGAVEEEYGDGRVSCEGQGCDLGVVEDVSVVDEVDGVTVVAEECPGLVPGSCFESGNRFRDYCRERIAAVSAVCDDAFVSGMSSVASDIECARKAIAFEVACRWRVVTGVEGVRALIGGVIDGSVQFDVSELEMVLLGSGFERIEGEEFRYVKGDLEVVYADGVIELFSGESASFVDVSGDSFGVVGASFSDQGVFCDAGEGVLYGEGECAYGVVRRTLTTFVGGQEWKTCHDAVVCE